MDISQSLQDEASYISESFGLPYATALEVTLANARRAARTAGKTSAAPVKTKKKSGRRVDR